MVRNLFQCCYTSQKGWRTLAYSDSIPRQAYGGCERIQSLNSRIDSIEDEQGNILNLLEVVGDAQYVYMNRTQYGLHDHVGRDNIFAHAYILSWEDALSDPNAFLRISDENFQSKEENVNPNSQDVVLMEAFTLPNALKQAHLTDKSYVTLIQCIYAQMFANRKKRPLYIQYDGSDLQMRSLLYCIYVGMPHYMRKQFSASSSATVRSSENRNVVFTQFAEQYELNFIPETGKNSILTARIFAMIQQYQFVDFAVNYRRQDSQFQMEDFFEKLDLEAVKFGDPMASNPAILKIVMQYSTSDRNMTSWDDDTLTERLCDVLVAPFQSSITMENYLTQMLIEYARRDLELNETSEEYLKGKCDYAQSEELKLAGRAYWLQQISKLNQVQLAKKLAYMSEVDFEAVSDELVKTEEGIVKLNYYYNTQLDEGTDWEGLEKNLVRVQDRAELEEIVDSILDLAQQKYNRAVDVDCDVAQNYDRYIQLMSILGMSKAKEGALIAKLRYWDIQKNLPVSLKKIDLYRKMEVEVENEACQKILECCEIIQTYTPENEWEFYLRVREFRQREQSKFAGTNFIENNNMKRLLEALDVTQKEKKHIEKWLKIVVQAQDAALELIEFLYHALRTGDESINKMLEAYKEIYKIEEGQSFENEVNKPLAQMLLKVCQKVNQDETQKDRILLDDWLTLGRVLEKNAFFIFNNVDPYIMEFRAEEIVCGSEYFGKLIEQARVYVHSPEARNKDMVQKWIKAWQKEKNVREKVEAEKQKEEARKDIKEIKGKGKKEKGLSKAEKKKENIELERDECKVAFETNKTNENAVMYTPKADDKFDSNKMVPESVWEVFILKIKEFFKKK